MNLDLIKRITTEYNNNIIQERYDKIVKECFIMRGGLAIPSNDQIHVILCDNINDTKSKFVEIIKNNNIDDIDIKYAGTKGKLNVMCDILLINYNALSTLESFSYSANSVLILSNKNVDTDNLKKLFNCDICTVYSVKDYSICSTNNDTNAHTRLNFESNVDLEDKLRSCIMCYRRFDRINKILVVCDKPSTIRNKIQKSNDVYFNLSNMLVSTNNDNLCSFYDHDDEIIMNELNLNACIPKYNYESAILFITKDTLHKSYKDYAYGFRNIDTIISYHIDDVTMRILSKISISSSNTKFNTKCNVTLCTDKNIDITKSIIGFYNLGKKSKDCDENIANCENFINIYKSYVQCKSFNIDKVIKYYGISQKDKVYMKRYNTTYLYDVYKKPYMEMYEEQMDKLYIINEFMEPEFDFDKIESTIEYKKMMSIDELKSLDFKANKKLKSYSGPVWIGDTYNETCTDRDYYEGSTLGFVMNNIVHFCKILASHKFTRRYKKPFMKEKVNKDKTILFLSPVYVSVSLDDVKKSVTKKIVASKSMQCIDYSPEY
jgi:hypothetical protein